MNLGTTVSCAAPAPRVIASPTSAAFVARGPFVEYTARAAAVSYMAPHPALTAAPAPVVEYVSAALAVRYVATAPAAYTAHASAVAYNAPPSSDAASSRGGVHRAAPTPRSAAPRQSWSAHFQLTCCGVRLCRACIEPRCYLLLKQYMRLYLNTTHRLQRSLLIVAALGDEWTPEIRSVLRLVAPALAAASVLEYIFPISVQQNT